MLHLSQEPGGSQQVNGGAQPFKIYIVDKMHNK